MYGGEIVDSNVIFGAVSALVLVVDAQVSNPYEATADDVMMFST